MSMIEKDAHGKSGKNPVRALSRRRRESSTKNTFLFLSSQGGVGKTSVVVNLALTLSKKGLKVGLMDANFQGPDVHKLLGLEPAIAKHSNRRFLPTPYSDDLKVASIESLMQDKDDTGGWGKPLKISDIRRFMSGVNWGRLDYLFIDTPQGPGEKLLAVIRGIPTAETIIVTAPHKIPGDRAKQMIHFLKKENISIFGWIENMRGFLCRHCGRRQELFSTGFSNRAIFLMEIPFLGRIPIDPYLSECVDVGKPFVEKYPGSQAAEAYELIAEKIIDPQI